MASQGRLADELPVLVAGDPRLSRRAEPVARIDGDVRRDMERVMATLEGLRRRNGFGRGLAAPQVGIGRRMVALDLGAGPFVLVNPEVVWASPETFEVWDDCFSVPELLVRVRRHRSISVEYRDSQFRLRRWAELPPDLAELLQHEIDHLDGVLMTERAVSGSGCIRPAAERGQLVDDARPSHRLSLARIAAAASPGGIDPVFTATPQFVSEPLSEQLRCELTLKVETVNPIRTFKGRGADFLLADLAQGGSAPGSLVCASAGNFGQAMAYACRKHGVPLVVFAAANASRIKVERMRALGAEVRLAGDDFDAAKELARRYAAESGASMIEDGEQAPISEGAGSIAVELLARDDPFDCVLVPLGNGALIGGVARWIKAASPATRVVGVSSRGAPAMAESWRGGAIVVHPRVDTIADGIAVRVPIPAAVADMRGTVDDVLLVDDDRLIEAVRLVHRHAGLVIEPSAGAGIAALRVEPERFAGQRVATILTGSNVTDDQLGAWLGYTFAS